MNEASLRKLFGFRVWQECRFLIRTQTKDAIETKNQFGVLKSTRMKNVKSKMIVSLIVKISKFSWYGSKKADNFDIFAINRTNGAMRTQWLVKCRIFLLEIKKMDEADFLHVFVQTKHYICDNN